MSFSLITSTPVVGIKHNHASSFTVAVTTAVFAKSPESNCVIIGGVMSLICIPTFAEIAPADGSYA